MTADLTTLNDVKAHLVITTTNAADDLVIQSLITAASAMINQFTQRSFIPEKQTRTYDARGEHIGYRCLDLDRDLLDVVSITNGDSTAITSTQYVLRESNLYPKWRIELLPSASTSWTYSTDWQDAISVVGIWGYHNDYANAWVNTLDTVTNVGGINASVTSMTVADADALDALGVTRFKVGQIIKIESEYVKVVAVDTGTNTITIARAQLGTTGASHAQTTAIYRLRIMPEIEQACISLTSWLYRNKENAGEDRKFLTDGVEIITNKAPVNIKLALDAYTRRGFGAA